MILINDLPTEIYIEKLLLSYIYTGIVPCPLLVYNNEEVYIDHDEANLDG